jgi:hypothetical protein
MTRFGNAPGPDVFEALAHAAFSRIPEPFAQHLVGVSVHVEEFADAVHHADRGFVEVERGSELRGARQVARRHYDIVGVPGLQRIHRRSQPGPAARRNRDFAAVPVRRVDRLAGRFEGAVEVVDRDNADFDGGGLSGRGGLMRGRRRRAAREQRGHQRGGKQREAAMEGESHGRRPIGCFPAGSMAFPPLFEEARRRLPARACRRPTSRSGGRLRAPRHG